jgi:hypothetical protein
LTMKSTMKFCVGKDKTNRLRFTFATIKRTHSFNKSGSNPIPWINPIIEELE